MKERRNSNIELLRIILMLMVITLHFNNGEMGGAFNFIKIATFNEFPFYFLESLSICAVNCFMIISGYFLAGNQKVKLGKIIDLLWIVIFYRLFDYFLLVITGNTPFEIKKLIYSFLPANYFAIFYIICYFFSPFINKLFDNLTSKSQKKLVLSLLMIFILWPTIIDFGQDILKKDLLSGISSISIHGNGRGYKILQFFVDLIIGIYIKKINFNPNIKFLIIAFVLSSLIMTFGVNKLPSIYNYCSIFTLINALCMFLIFNKLNFYSKIVNFISKSVFAIYCIHTQLIPQILWRRYCVTESHFSVSFSYSILWYLISVLIMFFACLLIDIIVRYTLGLLKNKICKKLPIIKLD